jgi:hypothetical protein
MGNSNSEITDTAFKSFIAGVNYLKSNKDNYDTELYNKIMLDYQLHFGCDEYYTSRFNGGAVKYVKLTDDQYKAYKRIVELVKDAKLVSSKAKNKSDNKQKNKGDVEGYNSTDKPSAPDSTDN